MNSKQKGNRGERAWRDELIAQGFTARRGQQFAGGHESPDVLCPSLPFHFEVKHVERLNVWDAMVQANTDAKPGNDPVVAHKRNRSGWLVTMSAGDWFRLVKKALCPN
jgi:Holliday junction resolvase